VSEILCLLVQDGRVATGPALMMALLVWITGLMMFFSILAKLF
jgi:hypothetical protein